MYGICRNIGYLNEKERRRRRRRRRRKVGAPAEHGKQKEAMDAGWADPGLGPLKFQHVPGARKQPLHRPRKLERVPPDDRPAIFPLARSCTLVPRACFSFLREVSGEMRLFAIVIANRSFESENVCHLEFRTQSRIVRATLLPVNKHVRYN
jgi:hypothetical protein